MIENYWLEQGELKEKDGKWHIRAHYYIPATVWHYWLYENCEFRWHMINSGTNLRTFVFDNKEDAVLFKLTWV